jgi:hypothetical protein
MKKNTSAHNDDTDKEEENNVGALLVYCKEPPSVEVVATAEAVTAPTEPSVMEAATLENLEIVSESALPSKNTRSKETARLRTPSVRCPINRSEN